jgi:arogenate/prephenate dehydratase
MFYGIYCPGKKSTKLKSEKGVMMGKIRVAFQGVQGAHTSTAIEKAFPDQNVDPIPFSTYEQAFEAVENKDCDYAVIPMENSLQGSIHSNYFLLARKFLYIVKEVHVPIHYSLIGLPDAKIEEISLVITHPGALSVCQGYLDEMPGKPAIETVYDSAGCVEMLLNFSNPETAMIGSKAIADFHQLTVLDDNIEDEPNNVTRYNVIAREPINPGSEGKTTLVFTTHHKPGALLNAMKVFAERQIDLTKIESRPLPDQPFEYMFYADIDGPVSDPKVSEALEELENYHAPWMRILGSYISIKD